MKKISTWFIKACSLLSPALVSGQGFVVDQWSVFEVDFEPIALIRVEPDLVVSKVVGPQEAGTGVLIKGAQAGPFEVFFTRSSTGGTVGGMTVSAAGPLGMVVEVELANLNVVQGNFTYSGPLTLSSSPLPIGTSSGGYTGVANGVLADLSVSTSPGSSYSQWSAGTHNIDVQWQW
jgi:hypothetical protein